MFPISSGANPADANPNAPGWSKPPHVRPRFAEILFLASKCISNRFTHQAQFTSFLNVSRIYFFLSIHSNLHHFSPNNLNILISLPAPSLIPESSIPYGPTRVIVLKHRPCPLLKNFPQRPITEREKSKIALMIWPQSVVFQSHLLPYFLCPLYCSLPNSFLDTLCVLTSQPLSSVWNNLWDPYLSLRTQPKCVPLREGLHSHP